MSADPMTTDQGDEIIRLLERIVEELREINGNTAHLFDIKGSLGEVEKSVLRIARKD